MSEEQQPQKTDDQLKAELIVCWMDKFSKAFAVPVEDRRVEIYIERLAGYSVKKLEKALSQALDNEQRFPTIAAIRQWIHPLEDPRNPRKEYRDLSK